MISEILLSGLDGGNPLAFLAAVGTHRALSLACPDRDIRMGWKAIGTWQPVISVGGEPKMPDGAVIDILLNWLSGMRESEALALDEDLNVTPGKFRIFANRAALSARPEDRSWADFAVAFGCEVVVDDGVIRDTALRTMSGAGYQHFLGFMRKVTETTSRDHLAEALFGPWQYHDEPPSMRWDPEDDRRYAHRWKEPSKDQIRTVRGANRLAIEALPLMPTMPFGRKLGTVGFSGEFSTDTYWTWPIWEPRISSDAVRSLLSLQQLQELKPPRMELSLLGVAEIYRAQRITVGKFRNFTPARSV